MTDGKDVPRIFRSVSLSGCEIMVGELPDFPKDDWQSNREAIRLVSFGGGASGRIFLGAVAPPTQTETYRSFS
jgi:hypothetical protein